MINSTTYNSHNGSWSAGPSGWNGTEYSAWKVTSYNYPKEIYEFKTQEYAAACRDQFNRLETAWRGPITLSFLVDYGVTKSNLQFASRFEAIPTGSKSALVTNYSNNDCLTTVRIGLPHKVNSIQGVILRWLFGMKLESLNKN